MSGLLGGGSPPKIKQVEPPPKKVEPDLDRARAAQDIKKRQRSLATRQGFGEENVRTASLGA